MIANRKLADIRDSLPVLSRHEGVWKGTYRYFDAAGNKVDEHRSVLACRLPTSGPFPYHQTNYYTWPDGRTETRNFPAQLVGDRLVWNNELINGWAADVHLDDLGRTTMLYWVRKDEPDTYIYEMIHISDCGQHRSRVWQWFRGGKLLKRTLIDEQKISDDWSGYPV